jgi:glycosyltransferase involved in cell wall biosynthesis
MRPHMRSHSDQLSAPAPDLAAAICTCDNIRTIGLTLASLRGLVRRIVVVDSGSADGTVELCEAHNAQIIHRRWDGPVDQKQFAIDQCRDHRWVLLLDSDEALEPELAQGIRLAVLRDDPAFDGWELNRKVWFMDGWLNHVFQPEWRLRLVRGGAGAVKGIGPQGRGGHDRIEVPGRVGRLQGHCRHDSWIDLRDMCLRYISLAERAAEHSDSGGKASDILLRPVAAVFKQLVMKRGILDGRRGLIAAGGVGLGVLMKHLFIASRRARSVGALTDASGIAAAAGRDVTQELASVIAA